MKYSANSVWENRDEYDVVVIGAGPVSYTHLDVYKRQASINSLANVSLVT